MHCCRHWPWCARLGPLDLPHLLCRDPTSPAVQSSSPEGQLPVFLTDCTESSTRELRTPSRIDVESFLWPTSQASNILDHHGESKPPPKHTFRDIASRIATVTADRTAQSDANPAHPNRRKRGQQTQGTRDCDCFAKMSFAYPRRKTSNPPPFKPRSSTLPHLRRSRVKTIAVIALIVIGGLWIASKIFSGHAPVNRQPSGNPKVLIVTTLDASAYGAAHTESVKENRQSYAARHGRHWLGGWSGRRESR